MGNNATYASLPALCEVPFDAHPGHVEQRYKHIHQTYIVHCNSYNVIVVVLIILWLKYRKLKEVIISVQT